MQTMWDSVRKIQRNISAYQSELSKLKMLNAHRPDTQLEYEITKVEKNLKANETLLETLKTEWNVNVSE